MVGTRIRNSARSLTLLGVVLGAAACADTPGLGPDGLGELPAFASDVTMLGFQSEVDAGAARIEIVLAGDGLLARDVAIKSGEVLRTPERIHGHITLLEPTSTGGLLTLDIGGLKVQFTGETGIGVFGTDGTMDLETFVARVTAALTEGHHPGVVAMRAPPDAPQAPGDDAFLAARLLLGGEGEGRILVLNIDGDNLVRNSSPPPDGWVAVLGLRIELRVTEGLTRIRKERDDFLVRRFEGVVQSVNLDAHTFTLRDGTVIRLVRETEIKYEVGDEHRLGSLEEVARAVNAGLTVVSAGAGVVEGREPLRLVAIAVVFELAPPPVVDFEGVVASVDLENRTVTLERGLTIRITDDTEIGFNTDREHMLGSLEEVAKAIADERTVVAAGVGVVEQQDPPVIVARKVVFVLRQPPMWEFRGVVRAVQLPDSIVVLVEGPAVRVTAHTEISFETGDTDRFGSLEAVAEAVAAGAKVLAAGVGEVASASVDPAIIVAKKIVFFHAPPNVTAFHGLVESVDLTAHTFTLRGGPVVRVVDGTVVWFSENDAHALRSLAAVAEALANHQVVLAAGIGVVEGTDLLTLVARKVAFMVVPPGIQYFEGVIASIDHERRSFTIEGGPTVRIVEGTLIVHQSGGEMLGSFEAVAEVVGSGGTVTAAGMGLLETSDPLVLIAIAVVFRL
ncbi:MAG: hypothetical protein OEO20_12465 [Gemmatimonadota bacterium]|nr:hypothetical protein [Gemmatimonadota bacterium]MDH3479107.1 hypothetical protein [Gemmatimonadota bacterium]MDH3570331.1 hypothetical protein [Gemmatimonadota bacterium]MDH5550427.1 hypothetical protein [Gemmatimonadota bacterium]